MLFFKLKHFFRSPQKKNAIDEAAKGIVADVIHSVEGEIIQGKKIKIYHAPEYLNDII